MICNNL